MKQASWSYMGWAAFQARGKKFPHRHGHLRGSHTVKTYSRDPTAFMCKESMLWCGTMCRILYIFELNVAPREIPRLEMAPETCPPSPVTSPTDLKPNLRANVQAHSPLPSVSFKELSQESLSCQRQCQAKCCPACL